MEPFEGMTPEERRADLQESGLDPDAVVQEVRADFARIAKEYKQRALREMQAGYEAAVERFHARKSHIPMDLAGMQAVYAQAQRAHPLTVQHRDFAGMSPDELHQLLEQLDALGLLPDEES
jgi:phytoene dehydrogenase-like protein